MGKRQHEKRIEQPPGSTNADLSGILKIFFLPGIISQFPQHFLTGYRPDLFIEYIERNQRASRYFINFEIEPFFPELSLGALLKLMLSSYRMLYRKNIPASGEHDLLSALRSFFDKRIKGSVTEDRQLSVYLVPYVLLGLCSLLVSFPFLCTRREFLVFLPHEENSIICQRRIEKELTLLGLKTTGAGFLTGSFHTDCTTFSGFQIGKGKISIPWGTTNLFLSEIMAMTRSGKKYSSYKAFVKRVDRRIQKFGHYYKYAPLQDLFSSLDKVILYYVGSYIKQSGSTEYANISNSGDYGLCSLSGLYERAKQKKCKDTISIHAENPFISRIASFIRLEQEFSHQIGLFTFRRN